MKKLLFIPALALLFSCGKQKLEEKFALLEGEWEYTSIQLQQNGVVTDYTSAHEGDILEFTSTKNVELKEEDGDVYYGTWDEFAGCISFYYDNEPAFKEIEFTGHNYTNNGSTIKFDYEYQDGTFYYTLRKIEPVSSGGSSGGGKGGSGSTGRRP